MVRTITDVYLGNDWATVAIELRELADVIERVDEATREKSFLQTRGSFVELLKED